MFHYIALLDWEASIRSGWSVARIVCLVGLFCNSSTMSIWQRRGRRQCVCVEVPPACPTHPAGQTFAEVGVARVPSGEWPVGRVGVPPRKPNYQTPSPASHQHQPKKNISPTAAVVDCLCFDDHPTALL